MNRKKSKILSMLLALCLIVGLMPMSAFAAGFTDVPTSHWGYDAITWAQDEGLVMGDNGAFRPNDPITRAEFAAIVQRLMKYPAASSHPFTDVAKGSWYEAPVAALYQAKVISGTSATTFAPTANITREAAALMLSRAWEVKADGTAFIYNDDAQISAWAKAAVYAMHDAKYMQGANGSFNPLAGITRAEVCQVLYNKEVVMATPVVDKTAPTITLSASPTANATSVTVTVTATDDGGIAYVGQRSSSGSATYTSKTGFTDITSAKSFNVTSNGWYAVCATDKAGNFAYKLIQITNIKASSGGGGGGSSPTYYSVTFNLNGAPGIAPVAQSVASGSAVALPTAPVWSGHSFDGWYKEAACTTAWNFATDMVTSATTLYAKWTVTHAPMIPGRYTYDSGAKTFTGFGPGIQPVRNASDFAGLETFMADFATNPVVSNQVIYTFGAGGMLTDIQVGSTGVGELLINGDHHDVNVACGFNGSALRIEVGASVRNVSSTGTANFKIYGTGMISGKIDTGAAGFLLYGTLTGTTNIRFSTGGSVTAAVANTFALDSSSTDGQFACYKPVTIVSGAPANAPSVRMDAAEATLTVNAGAKVGNINQTSGAANGKITINGTCGTITVTNDGTELAGTPQATGAVTFSANTTVSGDYPNTTFTSGAVNKTLTVNGKTSYINISHSGTILAGTPTTTGSPSIIKIEITGAATNVTIAGNYSKYYTSNQSANSTLVISAGGTLLTAYHDAAGQTLDIAGDCPRIQIANSADVTLKSDEQSSVQFVGSAGTPKLIIDATSDARIDMLYLPHYLKGAIDVKGKLNIYSTSSTNTDKAPDIVLTAATADLTIAAGATVGDIEQTTAAPIAPITINGTAGVITVSQANTKLAGTPETTGTIVVQQTTEVRGNYSDAEFNVANGIQLLLGNNTAKVGMVYLGSSSILGLSLLSSIAAIDDVVDSITCSSTAATIRLGVGTVYSTLPGLIVVSPGTDIVHSKGGLKLTALAGGSGTATFAHAGTDLNITCTAGDMFEITNFTWN